MTLRRLLYELMVVSPLLLILCITVQARTHVDGFTPQQYSTVLNERILAYVEPVRLAENAIARGRTQIEPEEVRKIAESWRDLAVKGVLKPLPPEAPHDSTQDGVKSQVRSAADEMAATLQNIARQETQRKEFWRAAQDAVLAVEAIQGVKYSDLNSVGMISIRQSASFTILSRVVPYLDSTQRAEVARRLDRVKEFERPLADAVLAQQRVMHARDKSRSQEMEGFIRQMLAICESGDEDVRDQMEEFSAKLASIPVDELESNSILPDFRFAWNARKNSLSNWEKVDRQLNSTRA